MTTNASVSVIEKLESLLARVTRRAAEPRTIVRHDAPTTAPPPLEAVSIAQPSAYPSVPAVAVPVPAPSAEAASVAVDEPMLIPVEESESDVELPIVEAVASPAAASPMPPAVETAPEPVAEVARFVPAGVTPYTDNAQTAPPPAPAPVVLDELELEPEPTPVPAPVSVPAAAPAAEAAATVSPPDAQRELEAAPTEMAPAIVPAAATIVATPAPIAAEPAPVIVDADTDDGSVPVMVDVPVVREAPAPEAPVVAAAARADTAPSLDGSHTQPPPVASVPAPAMFADEPTKVGNASIPPLELVPEPPAATATSEVADAAALAAASAEDQAAPPSSSRRIRTVPPIETTGLSHESGAHVLPEAGAPAELSLAVQGVVIARSTVADGASVASFVSAARHDAPATFGALLDATLSLGD